MQDAERRAALNKHDLLTKCYLMLGQRRRRWANIESTLGQRMLLNVPRWPAGCAGVVHCMLGTGPPTPLPTAQPTVAYVSQFPSFKHFLSCYCCLNVLRKSHNKSDSRKHIDPSTSWINVEPTSTTPFPQKHSFVGSINNFI